MTVIGIDPGPEESAFAVWDGKKILTHGNLANEYINYEIRFAWGSAGWRLSIEGMQSYGTVMGAPTIKTLIWIGRFVQAWETQCSVLPDLVLRPKIKAHICGNAAAKDGHVREALIDKIGPQGNKKNPGPTFGISKHVWQALAVAVYSYEVLV